MLKKASKYIIAIAFAIIFAVGFEFAIMNTTPTVYNFTFPGTEKVLYPSNDIKINDYDVDSQGNFKRMSNDSNILIDNISNVVSLKITLSSPATEDIKGKVYYTSDDKGEFIFYDNNDFIIKQGSSETCLNVNQSNGKFKVSMEGDFSLASIEASSQRLLKDPVSVSFDFVEMATLFLIFMAIFVVLAAADVHKKIFNCFKLVKIKNALKYLLFLFIGTFVASGGLWLFTRVITKREFTIYMLVFTIAVGCSVASLIFFRKKMGEKPENYFIVVSILLTIVISIATPISARSAWDVETHFKRALNMSYMGDTPFTEADNEIVTVRLPVSFSLKTTQENKEFLNDLYAQGTVQEKEQDENSIRLLGNIPNTIGVFLGRTLGLDFTGIFIAGKIANGLFYSIIMYLAIKKLKFGKMILSCVALLPTNIYLAANYSYDPWVTAFTCLGFSYFLYELQTPEKKIEWRNIGLMIAFMVLGMASKAIYFPLLALPLLLPKEKFKSARDLKLCRAAVLGGAGILLSSFLIPYLFVNPSSTGDLRGGSDVNGMGQIKFILSNPFAYANTLIRFLLSYLSIEGTFDYTATFAQLGVAPHSLINIVMLAVVSFTDRRKDEPVRAKPLGKAFIGLVLFGTVSLFATALYVDFTPVGSGTINGCQGRYIIPLLFPALYFVGFEKITNNVSRKTYNTVIFCAYTLYNFWAIWELLIRLYR